MLKGGSSPFIWNYFDKDTNKSRDNKKPRRYDKLIR